MHNLKKYYFINKFSPDHLINLDKNISLIWRSKHKDKNILEIVKTANFCKRNKRNLLLANDLKLAMKLKLNGVYLSANNHNLIINKNNLYKNFKVIGSAHNLKEIQIKKIQQADEILLSPVFKKKNINALGLYKLKHFFESFKKDKIALGGINSTNIKLIKLVNFRGFAAIDYFERQKKRPQKNWGL